MAENNNTQTTNNENTLGFKALFFLFLSKWYWFLVSVIIALGLGYYLYLRTPPVYNQSTQVLIKSDQANNGMNNLDRAGTFGAFNGVSFAANEIQAFLSSDIMEEVVRRLPLDVDYTIKGTFHNVVLYGRSQPAKVEFCGLTEQESGALTMEIDRDGHVRLSHWMKNGVDYINEPAIRMRIGDSVRTPLGVVKVTATDSKARISAPIRVTKSPLPRATRRYSGELKASMVDKQSDIIRLSVTDRSVERADDVLNMLIVVYNEKWVKDKNQIAASTSLFINDRLTVIEEELSGVDADISSYKSANMLPDVKAAASIYMNESSALSSQIMDLNNQLYMARYIRNYLTDEANWTNAIPSTSGISNSSVERQIAEYNEQMMKRNNLAAHSSDKNSLVVSADRSLETLRQSIISSVDNVIYALNSQIQSLRMGENRVNSKIAANPTQARNLLSVERQQSVKESLYLYLLQKREENELSQAFTAYNTRIIERPTGSTSPVSPKRNRILLVAFVLGIAVPGGLLFAIESMDSKVRNRSDLSPLTIPFAGEVPEHPNPDDKKLFHYSRVLLRKIQQRQKKNTGPAECQVVVHEGKRDVSNEAFRVLRTNLEYMSGKDCTIFQQTSFNSGSGKSFVSINVGICLALKKKRVLLIDGDLRHATLSASVGSPKQGISNYLSEQIELEQTNSLLVDLPSYPSVKVLPVGKIPPNPTELIGNGRLTPLLQQLRNQFDYIFIDCPPIDIVADTQIIAQDVDRTLFVIRAGLMERSLVHEIQQIADSGRLKNVAVVLNGTKYEKSSYSHHRGYGYGYRYGYGYGYGYHKSYGHDYYTDND